MLALVIEPTYMTTVFIKTVVIVILSGWLSFNIPTEAEHYTFIFIISQFTI